MDNDNYFAFIMNFLRKVFIMKFKKLGEDGKPLLQVSMHTVCSASESHAPLRHWLTTVLQMPVSAGQMALRPPGLLGRTPEGPAVSLTYPRLRPLLPPTGLRLPQVCSLLSQGLPRPGVVEPCCPSTAGTSSSRHIHMSTLRSAFLSGGPVGKC